MVGHTGVIPAAVEAIETVDTCLGSVVEAVHASGGACFITADHGNADHMLEPDGSPNTAHSLNPVPVIVTVARPGAADGGVLADVAPTVLELLGIEQPQRDVGPLADLALISLRSRADARHACAVLRGATGAGRRPGRVDSDSSGQPDSADSCSEDGMLSPSDGPIATARVSPGSTPWRRRVGGRRRGGVN